ncbi:protein MIX23-like [Portunus trituberculatus]|uniref:protein MIX23-like n=1 Tax=Portunus trituberculatus TaxID=210409 RepID=UPI001E1CC5C5|nr:protein MIX23-like [Portunus trituberculatus]
MDAPTPLSCQDITDTLRAMRTIDDKIIYELNLATPTQSFRSAVDPRTHCQELYTQLNKMYSERGSLISQCEDEARGKLRAMQGQLASKRDDPAFMRKLRSEQSKVRELQNETTIEEIIRERSLKVFEEKCRHFYKPPPKPE